MSLRDLEVFEIVAEAGSTRDAAHKIGITQSAVSQTIARLERHLAVALFDRAVRPIRINPAGEILRKNARAILATAEQTVMSIQQVTDTPLPLVRLGLVDSCATTVGPALVRYLRAETQHVRVWSGITPMLTRELLDRSIDILLSTDSLSERSDLIAHHVYREPLIAVVPQTLGTDEEFNVLEGGNVELPLIRYSARSALGLSVEYYLRQRQMAFPHVLEFDVSESMFAMVKHGIGWAITTPLCLVQARVPLSSVRPVLLPQPWHYRHLYVTHRVGEFERLGESVASFCCDRLSECVSTYLSDDAPAIVQAVDGG